MNTHANTPRAAWISTPAPNVEYYDLGRPRPAAE
jgi:hypothetical protein